MTALVQTWANRVTIADIATDVLAVSTSHGVRQIGTCDLELPSPAPAHVVVGAVVTVEASLNGAWLDTALFTGYVRSVDPGVSAGGLTTRVHCLGPAYKLAYPLGRDVTWTGGAKVAPVTIVSSPIHVGEQTIANYDDDVPNGITVTVTATPATDADFIWLTGILHGTNSYNESIGDKKIKSWSRVEVWQGSTKRGYANFPVNNEQYDEDDPVDWTDHDEWDDFELYIACHPQITTGGGDIEFRFISGLKPGTSTRDEYEIDDVAYQTAGRQTLRRIVRGMLAKSGITLAQRDVYEVTDIDGDPIYLGGNGLVDAGQIRIEGREQPLTWLSRTLDLFGFVLFDSPDGVVRVRPHRGSTPGPARETFVQQVNILSVSDAANDPSRVYNSVLVRGASGSDEDGKRFTYEYQTDPDDVLDNDAIPDPPGTHQLTLSSSLLTSDALCLKAGEIAEVNNNDATTITFDTWPHTVRPNNYLAIDAPSADVSGMFRTQSVRTTIDAGGYRQTITAWRGTAHPFAETPDPDLAEADIEPETPRPDEEWLPYAPSSSVSEVIR